MLLAAAKFDFVFALENQKQKKSDVHVHPKEMWPPPPSRLIGNCLRV